MHRYRVGLIEGSWENFTPPIQGGVFRVRNEFEEDEGYNSASSEEKIDGEETLNNGLRRRANTTSASGRDALLSPESYTAGRVQHEVDTDIAKYPSLDESTQRNIALKFEALHERVRSEGYYDCRFREYGKEMIRYAALFALFAFTLQRGWYFVSACFLGLFWHQIMFTAHDAGHRGITHDFNTDTLIGIFIADVCCGLSLGWWKSSHNVHHLVTNHPVSIYLCRPRTMPRAVVLVFKSFANHHCVVGTRPGHSKRAFVRHFAIVLQLH